MFTIAKQVFKNRAVRCPGISSWALGFENHIVAHCIMRKSSAWEVSFCVRSSQITMGVSRCQTCFGDCGRIRYMTYSHKTNWVDECPSRHRVISSTHVLPLAWPCSECVVRLHSQSLSCVFTITSYSECLWHLRSCCCGKDSLLLVTVVVVAVRVTLRLPGSLLSKVWRLAMFCLLSLLLCLACCLSRPSHSQPWLL